MPYSLESKVLPRFGGAFCMVAGLLAGSIMASSANAAAFILGVDFGALGTPNNSPLQTGFQAFNISVVDTNGPITKDYAMADTTYTTNTVSVTLSGGTDLASTAAMNARDRTTNSSLVDSGDFNYSSIYRDIVNSKTSTLSIGISGLNPNTQYAVTFYVYDTSYTRTMTFTDYTSGAAGVNGSVAYTANYNFDSTTPNSIFSKTLTVTSNASGNLVFRDVANNNNASISALTIAPLAIPEPASAGLGFLSLGVVSHILRKKR